MTLLCLSPKSSPRHSQEELGREREGDEHFASAARRPWGLSVSVSLLPSLILDFLIVQ